MILEEEHLDATLLKISATELEVLNLDGDPELGGEDITQIVCELIYERIEDELDLDMFDVSASKLDQKQYASNKNLIYIAC